MMRHKRDRTRPIQTYAADLTLDYIGALYVVEVQIREKTLTGNAKPTIGSSLPSWC
jgi:hypothetical protein